MHHQITPGAVVLTADQIELRVRSIEGNVAELEAFDGSFVGFRHVSSLTVCLPPATQTALVPGLAAAAVAGQGAGTLWDSLVFWLIVFVMAVPAVVVPICIAYCAFVVGERMALVLGANP
ncbi:hypothetical protein [Paracidovorax citrulli]|uniref:hypothetical protein n=1 Tax=Paracidovorax citrulli TaxID=80869 RepID=UPI00066477D5|nr:hypothetical protein [Paracidovorax citrulli]UMT96727.1 hypothetical protein FRC97_17990 [Paracidovorax citrulli]